MDGIFFYKDPTTGKRRPLPFFYGMLMVIGFLLVLALVGLYIVRDKQTLLTPPTSSSVSLATNTPAPTATDTPIPTATWTPAPTQDPLAAKRQTLLQAINECEKDPSKWTFSDLYPEYPGGAWKKIESPECVMVSLGRAVAWLMLVYGGYTFDEAAQALGFERFPVLYPSRDGAGFPFRTLKGVWQANFDYFIYHPEVRMWLTDEEGNPVLPTFTPRGCYRARHLLRGVWQDWREWYNAPYLVQCYLYGDETRFYWIVQRGDEIHRFDMPGMDVSPKIRQSYLFGYDPDRGWYLVGGFISDERFYYTPDELKTSEWPPASDYQDMVRLWGREDIVWNAEWIKEVWGLEPKPAPENIEPTTSMATWRSFWKPVVRYFHNQWPERDRYFWKFQNPPDRP